MSTRNEGKSAASAPPNRGAVWEEHPRRDPAEPVSPLLRAGHVAFLFPSQGSEQPAMPASLLSALGEDEAAGCKATIGCSAERLLAHAERVAAAGGPAGLGDEVLVQAAMHLCAMLALRCLRRTLPPPAAVLGYSSGVYAALSAAGCLSFADGLRCVWRAGELLSAAAMAGPRSGMTAVIGVPPEKLADAVARACGSAPGQGAQGTLVISHWNASRQHILAGDVESLSRAEAVLANHGALAIKRLPYRLAYHSPLVHEAAAAFAQFASTLEIGDPEVPVIDAAAVRVLLSRAEIREYLARQLAAPVRFADSVAMLAAQGCLTYCEVGPGQNLGRLVRWTDRRARVLSCGDTPEIQRAVEILGQPA
ncbi:MAG: ACP S-malonyltransferase [Candidatus Schekmanbacteria bacterium]|nr:ACP S-malonyltransferase [Candidatus Schekmanbacteria bacterium]